MALDPSGVLEVKLWCGGDVRALRGWASCTGVGGVGGSSFTGVVPSFTGVGGLGEQFLFAGFLGFKVEEASCGRNNSSNTFLLFKHTRMYTPSSPPPQPLKQPPCPPA